jgi:hypothetical protein
VRSECREALSGSANPPQRRGSAVHDGGDDPRRHEGERCLKIFDVFSGVVCVTNSKDQYMSSNGLNFAQNHRIEFVVADRVGVIV